MTTTTFQGMEKVSRGDLVAGDTVAYRRVRSMRRHLYGFATVERVTKTQVITQGGTRYAKTTGEVVGESGCSMTTIYALGYVQPKSWGQTEANPPMYEVVLRERALDEVEQHRAGVIHNVLHLAATDKNLMRLSTSDLEAVLTLLQKGSENVGN